MWVFGEVRRRQGMANIERANAVVQEVWRRTGVMGVRTGRRELWREVCADMGIAIVFG